MANRMKQLREAKGWTQAQLSEASGVSRVTINGLESGRIIETKTSTLTKIADALGETVSGVFFYQ